MARRFQLRLTALRKMRYCNNHHSINSTIANVKSIFIYFDRDTSFDNIGDIVLDITGDTILSNISDIILDRRHYSAYFYCEPIMRLGSKGSNRCTKLRFRTCVSR